MRKFFFVLSLCVAFLCPWQALASHDEVRVPCGQVKSPRARAVVELVHDAVEEMEAKGEEAFAVFSERGSKWRKNDSYIFVHDLNGKLVCNNSFRSMVGRNMYNFKDVSGKPVVRFLIEQVTAHKRNSGWVHYLWPAPGGMEPRWKSTYAHLAVGPDGEKYVVAAGLHDLPMERCFAIQEVEDALDLINEKGISAFSTLRSRSGPFVWGETYVFVIGYDGVQYVNPGKPLLEGLNVKDFTDVNGKKIFSEMLKAARKDTGVWYEYMWPKPGVLEPRQKITYIRRVTVEGEDFLIGCGMYVE